MIDPSRFPMYFKRFKYISPAEFLYRIRCVANDTQANVLTGFTRNKHAKSVQPTQSEEIQYLNKSIRSPRLFPLVLFSDSQHITKAYIKQADHLMSHTFHILNKTFQLPPLILWNEDLILKKMYPLCRFPGIHVKFSTRYRYVKYTWELNRHQHLPILALAFRFTGNVKYLKEILEQIETWVDQCPFPRGINWADTLEISVRLLSWIITLNIIESTLYKLDQSFHFWIESVFQHIDYIDRHYSLYSSANNHLIGETAAVYMATCFFPFRNGHKEKNNRAKKLILTASQAQIRNDGVHFEFATRYHIVVFEALVMAFLFGLAMGDFYPDSFEHRLKKAAEFTVALIQPGFRDPQIGDSDDGHFLNPGYIDQNHRNTFLFQIAYLIAFKEKPLDIYDISKIFFESIVSSDQKTHPVTDKLHTSFFNSSGIFVFYYSISQLHDFRFIFNCTPTGDTGTAAHGHADALSLYFDARDQPILIDPGTYHYHDDTHRIYFKETYSHNTLFFKDACQSKYEGSFLWGKRCSVRIIDITETDSEIRIHAVVTWWQGQRHFREITVFKQQNKVKVHDVWIGESVGINFTIHPAIHVEIEHDSAILSANFFSIKISTEAPLKLVRGFVSNRFGRLETTCRLIIEPPRETDNLVTWISW